LHERADNPYADGKKGGIPVVRSAQLVSYRLGLYGVADTMEFHNDAPLIIEYKHGTPKISDCDRLQLAAQVMAYEEMRGAAISEAALFYWKIRRREVVPITLELRNTVESMSAEMHGLKEKGIISSPIITKACKACSLYETCGPSGFGKSASDYLKGLVE
jgi:CRISPR-associated exonuclease Cas4